MKPRDIGQLVLLSFIWGSTFIAIKVAIETLSPFQVAILRLLFGALVLGALAFLSRNLKLKRQNILPLLGMALFGCAIPFVFFSWGEKTVPSSVASVLNATTPLWTIFISVWLGEARLKPKQIGGVILGFLGVVLVIFEGLRHGAGSFLGITLIAIASATYALSAVISKRYLKGLPAATMSFYQMSFALLMLLPTLLFTGVPHPSLHSLVAVAFLGFVGSGLAYMLYYNILARVHAAQASSVTYMLPVWGLLWGYLAGEPVSGVSILGVLVILTGIGLLS